MVLFLVALALLGCTGVYLYFRRGEYSLRPLPGPRGQFWSGNANEIPALEAWRTYAKWAEKFGRDWYWPFAGLSYSVLGPLVQFRVYSRKYLVLNSADSVTELLENRKAIYSDRPMAWMFFKLCGRGLTVFNISSLHERHKKYRKLLHSGLSSSATQDYWPFLQSEARSLCHGIQEQPEFLESQIRKYVSALLIPHADGFRR